MRNKTQIEFPQSLHKIKFDRNHLATKLMAKSIEEDKASMTKVLLL